MTRYPQRTTLTIMLDGIVDVSRYVPIINTHHFQRLKGVRQLDMAWVAYPDANGTRFSHSVGTMQKFNKMFMYRDKNSPNTDMNEDEKELVKVASLLHDIPHPALAHLAGYVEQALTGKTHDDLLPEILEKYYEDPLKECGFSVKDIKKVTAVNNPMREIIWSITGVDKLDYIQRDMHQIGLPAPNIDPLLEYTVFFKNRGLCAEVKNVNNVTSFIKSYCTAYKDVYWKKSCLIAQTMMRRVVWDGIENGVLSLKKMHEMQDWEVSSAISNSKGKSRRARYLHKKILLRELYKTAVCLKIEGHANSEEIEGKYLAVAEVTEEEANKCLVESKNLKEIIELEADLSRELGTDIIISTTPEPDRLKPKNPKVYSADREEIQNLSDIDPAFLRYQAEMPGYAWSVRVTVPEKDRKRIAENRDLVKHRLLFN